MKQHNTVNINVKVKLNRPPSVKERRNLVEWVASVLDCGGSDDGLYWVELTDDNNKPLNVEHHFVTVRKMGR